MENEFQDFSPGIGPPHMTVEEIALFEHFLSNGVNTYLEFGIGGSTLAACRSGAKTIVGVDSDLTWVERVSKQTEIANKLKDGSASILHADIGPVGEWGTPIDQSYIKQWHRYISAPWEELAKRRISPDFIFIDGRFRVSCCCSVILALAGLPLAKSPTVFFHDFVEARRSYRKILDYYDIIDQVASLCALRIRNDAQVKSAISTFLINQFDPL